MAGGAKNDVGTATRIGEAALEAGVRRLIYTGTIASYDMSDPRAVITEETGFGEIETRNLYARSKAECERQPDGDAPRQRGLPLVIARPGIVVGGDGPLQHWGIGRWHGPGAVKLWGDGRNILPFVLVDDLCAALIAMMTRDGVEGQSFNLTGAPMLTGRDYFDAIHARLGARLRVTSGNLTAMWMADCGEIRVEAPCARAQIGGAGLAGRLALSRAFRALRQYQGAAGVWAGSRRRIATPSLPRRWTRGRFSGCDLARRHNYAKFIGLYARAARDGR